MFSDDWHFAIGITQETSLQKYLWDIIYIMVYCGHVCEEFVDEIKQVGKVQTKAGTVLFPELVT